MILREYNKDGRVKFYEPYEMKLKAVSAFSFDIQPRRTPTSQPRLRAGEESEPASDGRASERA